MARIRTIDLAEHWAEDFPPDAPAFWLYCVVEEGFENSGPCKVGIASNISKRLSALQGGNHRRLSFAWLVRLPDRDRAKDVEQSCLMQFRPSPYGDRAPRARLESEWISAPPSAALAHAVARLNVEQETVRRVA